jgi:hypothetical protein
MRVHLGMYFLALTQHTTPTPQTFRLFYLSLSSILLESPLLVLQHLFISPPTTQYQPYFSTSPLTKVVTNIVNWVSLKIQDLRCQEEANPRCRRREEG